MKKSAFVFLMLATGISFSLFAQGLPPQEIRRVYQDTVNGAVPAQIISTMDCGFAVAGTSGQQGFLLKLNASGDSLWRKTYLFGEETAFNSLAELPAGELVAVGRCVNCAPGDTTQKALAVKVDAAGNALQDTTFGRLNYNASATAVIANAAGQAVVAGTFVWATFLSPSNVFLAVLDENLNPGLWGEYNELYYDTPQGLAQTADGGYLLAGNSNASLASAAQAQLFRTDGQGQLLWKNTSAFPSSWFNGVQEAPDGRIVALGWKHVDEARQRDAYLAVHDPASGNLLFDTTYGSPGVDEGHSLHAVEGGYLAAGVWGAASQPGWGRRDWVFRLDSNFNIAHEYLDEGYLAHHNMVNAIPLSPDGRSFAYFSRIQIFSDWQNLLYKRTLQGRYMHLSKAPRHYQLLPRDLSTNKGTAVYEGSLETPGAYDEVRLKVFRNDVLVQTLNDNTPAAFSFQVEIPAELANYRFKLMGVKNGLEYPEAEAHDVVAGDAYIIQGQSNAVAAIPFDLEDTIPHAYRYRRHPFVRNFGLKYEGDSLYVWHKEADDNGYYADNRSGQWGLLLAKKIAEEQGIPVAILNGGIGGIAIDNMLPDPLEPHSTSRPYGQFYQRLDRSGLRNHIRAILFFQGETNALPGYNETVESYKNKYLQLQAAWQSDFSFEREYLFQIRPGCWDGNFSVIQEAQRQLALEIPQMGIMSSTGMEHDGCHYHYFNGYERAGEDLYRLLARDLYGAPPMPNINPPAVDSAWFSRCDRQEITLRLHNEGDAYFWAPGWETDFRLEGAEGVTVASGQVSGNIAMLSLSETPSLEFSGLSYISHTQGSEAPVKNANGIGLLAFYNFPVAPPEPLIETYSLAICPGESYVLPDGVVADAPGMYISGFISQEGCDSLIVTDLAFFEQPAISGPDVQPVSCSGLADGAITAHPQGGAEPYEYLWSSGQTTAMATGLPAGQYGLTVTDANGCTITESITVTEPSALEGAVASIDPATCQEAEDGSATVEALGGTPPYSFLWGDGQSGPDADGLAPGDYLVSVTDANGCQVELGLTAPAGAYEPNLGISQEGEVLTVAEAGAEYQWIDCQTGEALSGANEQFLIPVVSGAYAVVVTDSPSGCQATSECVQVMVVGAEDAARPAQQATAFPNPGSGQFTLVLPWAAEALLYDASGRLLRRESYGPGSHQLAMSELPAGVYVLALKRPAGTQVLRLIKN